VTKNYEKIMFSVPPEVIPACTYKWEGRGRDFILVLHKIIFYQS
jgi:hypothetical protein